MLELQMYEKIIIVIFTVAVTVLYGFVIKHLSVEWWKSGGDLGWAARCEGTFLFMVFATVMELVTLHACNYFVLHLYKW